MCKSGVSDCIVVLVLRAGMPFYEHLLFVWMLKIYRSCYFSEINLHFQKDIKFLIYVNVVDSEN